MVDYFEATRKTYEKAKLGPDVLLPRNLWIRDVPEKILECLFALHNKRFVC